MIPPSDQVQIECIRDWLAACNEDRELMHAETLIQLGQNERHVLRCLVLNYRRRYRDLISPNARGALTPIDSP